MITYPIYLNKTFDVVCEILFETVFPNLYKIYIIVIVNHEDPSVYTIFEILSNGC